MKIIRRLSVYLVCVVVFVFSVVCQTSCIAAEPDGLQVQTNYLIVSKKTGQAMTVENYTSATSAGICQMPLGNYQAQVWTLEDMEDGYYRIVNKFSNLALNMPHATVEDGAQVVQWNKEKSDNSKWKITQLEDGLYRITPKLVETFSLAVEEGNTNRGAAIVQSTFENTENAVWELRPIEESLIMDNPELEVAQPDKALEAYIKMFTYEEDGVGKLNYCEPFWTSAETIEMLIDAYERFGEEKYKTLFCKQIDGFVKRNGTSWKANPYNDDMMWAVIMVSRAYLLTGEERYLTYAEKNFKDCFERGWSEDLGGGLWWKNSNEEKNSCANGPGAVAACLLGQATGNEEYYEKAKMIIEWEYEVLSDKEGGIWDSIQKDGVTYNKWVSTYNQGTFIGACTMLYQYYNDQKFYDWAKAAADRAVQLGSGTEGYLNGEQSGVDLMGFKGILARWMGYFAVNCNIDDYNDWMQRNADSAWTNRNSDDLMWTQFGKVTEENIQLSTRPLNDGKYQVGEYSGWACSPAVAWLLDCTGIDERQEKKLQQTESRGITAAKTAISNVIQMAKNTYDAGQGEYSDPSWEKFVTAYNNALNLDTDAAVNELKAIQYALEESQNSLKLKNPPGKRIEIESGEQSSGTALVEAEACSGGIYVGNVGGEEGRTITFMVTAERAGEHMIAVNYCTYGDRQLKVLVNGMEYPVTCKGAGSWDKPAANPVEVIVSMHKGENTIVFAGVGTSPTPNLDCFEYNRTDSKENGEIDTITDELNVAVLKADEVFSAGQNNYTEESWDRFKAAYEVAVNPIGAVSAENLSEIKDELINALNGLKEKFSDSEMASDAENSVGDDGKQEKKIEKIKIEGISKKIAAGKKVTLTAMIFPGEASGKEIVWESSNKKFATVTEKGVVKTKKAGRNKSVIITARAKDNDGIKAVYKIKIMPQAVKKIVIKADTQTVKAGSKISLKAVVTPMLASRKINTKLKWSSSNEGYATVTSKGVVNTKKAGKGETVKITAKTTDGSNKKKSIVIKIK